MGDQFGSGLVCPECGGDGQLDRLIVLDEEESTAVMRCLLCRHVWSEEV